MVSGKYSVIYIALLCSVYGLASATPHGKIYKNMGPQHGSVSNMSTSIEWSESFNVPAYFSHDGNKFWIYAHIFIMILSWGIWLPLTGAIYNAATPDLYSNNSHQRMGWVMTWISLVWIMFGILNAKYHKYNKNRVVEDQYRPDAQPIQKVCRWSDDSGHGTSRNSIISSDASSATELVQPEFLHDCFSSTLQEANNQDEKRGFLHHTNVDRFTSSRSANVIKKSLATIHFVYVLLERTLILAGFAVICTGFIVWAGIFRGSEVFTGLAHFIKGGIFFWIGLLIVGRWAGAFADLGWAWNVKPPSEMFESGKRSAPSMEFVESALICVYGLTNIWLEHLGAWGSAWTAMDYEHLSITILFLAGGLLGLLVESERIRNLLNRSLALMQPDAPHNDRTAEIETIQAQPTWDPLATATTPLNPLPALVILLLGITMAAHIQHSALAATMHSLWGALFVCAALMRLSTYLLHYLRPPSSYLPSRPPTELLTGFLLTGGGSMFIISARDITDLIQASGADGMVAFVMSMGFTAVMCAGVVVCMAAKGWAVARKNQRH